MGAVIGVDDTDSRTAGMCTTYVGAIIADDLEAAGHEVTDRRLIRLNPAIEYKTRGNAAVAIATSASPSEAMALASDRIESLAESTDPNTQPGLVVVDPSIAPELADYTWDAIREVVPLERTKQRLDVVDALTWSRGGGRGLIGATAAIGSDTALDEWTVELLLYRESAQWGTPRDVNADSVFAASESTYPRTWDTVDVSAGEVVCIPNTPGPVLAGLRGDDAAAVRQAADHLEHEPTERTSLYRTNQGTDNHLRHTTPASALNGRSYRITGIVSRSPETREGGHVHLEIRGDGSTLPCVAFEPTGRFRDHIRQLLIGDHVTVCGEISQGTMKLEKFALRRPRRYRLEVPSCPVCDSRMESAGSMQGYRCRPCETTRATREPVAIDREIEVGWYEVPPVARRHLARPLVRGGMDGPVHPER